MPQRIRGLQVFVDGIKVQDNERLFLGHDKDDKIEYASGYYMIGPGPTSGFWSTCPSTADEDPQYAGRMMDDFFVFDTLSGSAWVVTADASSAVQLEESSTSGSRTTGVLKLWGHSSGSYCFMQGGNGGAGSGGPIKLSAGKKVWYEASVNFTVATKMNAVVGLMSPLAGGGCMLSTDASIACSAGVYFQVEDYSGSLISTYVRNSNTAASIQIGASTHSGGWKRLGMYWDGYTLTPYVNGTACTSISGGATAGFPNGFELTPTFAMTVGDAKDTLTKNWVDYIKIVAER